MIDSAKGSIGDRRVPCLRHLLDDGHPVRLSGQDSSAGTFSQRHSVLIDQDTEARYVPPQQHSRRPGPLRGRQFLLSKRRCSVSNTLFAEANRMR